MLKPSRRDAHGEWNPISVSVAHGRRYSMRSPERGGDFFAAERMPDGCLTIAVGDVSAKAVIGYRYANILTHTFRAAAVDCARPSRVLRALSASLLDAAQDVAPSDDFAAVFVARIDPYCETLIYASAGVEGGMLFNDGFGHTHLDQTGPLLGIVAQPAYRDFALPFRPGGALVTYTDGVTEARSVVDARPLGSCGVAQCMRRVVESKDPLTCERLWNEIDAYTGGWYRDDATLALVTAQNRGPAAW